MNTSNESWAVVELMGHVTLAGRVTKPGEYGGLWQIDIPHEESFRTEFFGSQSVYRIRMVSEEIARGYNRPNHEIIAYDAPIVTREEHEDAMNQAREVIDNLRRQVQEQGRKLLSFPSGVEGTDILDASPRVAKLWEENLTEDGIDDD